jgi:4-coumarate--CoA ligase
MFDGVEVKERNSRGELWVRAPNVMKGYWRNEKATKETKTEDGWLLTGDIAFVDDDGKFHVVDRMKVCFKEEEEEEEEEECKKLTWTGINQSQRQPGGARRIRGSFT